MRWREKIFKEKNRILLKRVSWYVGLSVGAILTIAPFYWAVMSSFKLETELFEATLWPNNVTFQNYINLFLNTGFIRWFLNSSLIAISFTVVTLFFCSLAGFAFAKYNFKFKNTLFLIILITMMIPVWTTIVPIFIIFSKFHLLNTYWALILPGSSNVFGIFLMRQYIQTVPSELIDSARIDGCSEFMIYYHIVLPVIKPAIGTLAIFSFFGSWNNFLGALIFMRTPDMFTIPPGLASLLGQVEPRYGTLMAATLISTFPIIIIFTAMQKQFVAGLTLGAVKG